MKKLLLLLSLFSLIIAQTKAQTSVYHPLPESNAYWNQEDGYTDGGGGYGQWDYSLFVNGDSTVSDTTYKKFYRSGTGHGFPGLPISYHDELIALIRQEPANKKIFIRDGLTDELLYDFNLAVGDTMKTYSNGDVVISAIDSILIGSDYRKRFWISSNPGISIIEGIGSTYGLLAGFEAPFEHWNYLYCFVVNGQTLFHTGSTCDFMTSTKDKPFNELFNISPNPATSQLTIRTTALNNDEHATICIANALGENMLSNCLSFGDGKSEAIDISKLAAGFYFVQLITEQGSVTKKLVKE